MLPFETHEGGREARLLHPEQQVEQTHGSLLTEVPPATVPFQI